MNVRDRRLWVIVGGLAAVIVLFFVLRPSDDDEAATTTAAEATAAATTEQSETTTVTETLTETAPGVTVTEEQPAETTPAEPDVQRFTARIEGGSVVGGIQRWQVAQGDDVRIVVRSDVDDELHLHGYDIEMSVGPGSPAIFTFGATIPGRFELESHEGGGQIAQLDVQP
jgi:hypothetical protein